MEGCRRLGLFPALITNDKSDFSFAITILKKQIISQSVSELQNKLGLQLNADETALFAYLVSNRSLSLAIAKAITGKSSELTLNILAKLEAIQVTKSSDHKQAWSLSEDIVQQIDKTPAEIESGQVGDQVTGQATDQVTGQVTGQALYDKKQEIPRLNPRLEEGIVLMKYPDKPKHPKQKYYLSDYGKELLQAMQGEH